MKTFIVTLFLILLFVVGYLLDDGVGMFSHIASGFLMSFFGYAIVYAICGVLDDDSEFLFPWVAGILNVLLILVVYSFLFLK